MPQSLINSQERESRQMEACVDNLTAILHCLSRKLDNNGEIDRRELYDYIWLLQEQVDAILWYKKLAYRWSTGDKSRAQMLLALAITSQSRVAEILETQCTRLAGKIAKIELFQNRAVQNRAVYGGSRATAQLLDLKG